ncbi:MAG: DUF3135 domain-containing protein [Nitrosomonas sp.]|nr:DUF3135 domain-containing protein [Nitrosomonas sp.]
MKNNKTPTEFDFDHWVKVAEQDPEKFEEMRAALINDLMEQSPEQFRQRLEGLQWQIDQVRNKSSNPMESCIAISNKMWDHFYGEKGLISALKDPEKILQSNTDNTPNKVVSIKNHKPSD